MVTDQRGQGGMKVQKCRFIGRNMEDTIKQRIDNPIKIRGQLRYRFVKPTYRAKPSELFYTRGDCGVVFFRREVAELFRGLTDKQRNDVAEIVALMLDCAQATALKKGVISVPEVC